MKPFIKWAGGKAKLLSVIEKNVPQSFDTYFEPFMGGGSVMLHLGPSKAFVGDYNEQLMNVYEMVRDECDSLLEALDFLKRMFDDSKNKKIFYYSERSYFMDQNPIQDAATFIFLNKTCFNGLYRVNSNGHFNVSFNNSETFNFDADNIREISKYLNEKDITLSSGSYKYSTKIAKKDDFIYFDPPYMPLNKTSNFTGYTNNSFSINDQVMLSNYFKELTKKGVKCLLSNSDTELIRTRYAEFEIITVEAARSINSKGNKRQKITELLIKNY